MCSIREMGLSDGDLNALIEIQITDTYLRDLLQRHRHLLKGQFMVTVV